MMKPKWQLLKSFKPNVWVRLYGPLCIRVLPQRRRRWGWLVMINGTSVAGGFAGSANEAKSQATRNVRFMLTRINKAAGK